MKSPRGFAAAIVLLLAIPIAALYRTVFDGGGEAVIHAGLAAGALVLSVAVGDFKTGRWTTWMGRLSTGFLGIIFALQGFSELVRNQPMTHLAYQVLGQGVETGLFVVFLAWCATVLHRDSQGKTRMLGVVAVSMAAGLELYRLGWSYLGGRTIAASPVVRLLTLLLFVWLLFESGKSSGRERSLAVSRETG